jgi:hypothetical protein
MNRSLGRRRAQPRAQAATLALLLALLPAVSARAHHWFAAEYDVEAIGASHGG